MKPSIGRIVHVKVNNLIVAGIIVKVWSDTCINVRVFFDGTNDVPEGTSEWITSVTFVEDPANNFQDHQWTWPPRV